LLNTPLYVNWLPAGLIGYSGLIGITFAPGKKDGKWERDLEADLERIARVYGATLLVSLLEAHEYVFLATQREPEVARLFGMEFESFPITDMDAPKDLPATIALVQRLLAHAEAGRRCVVHCYGGIGRAGTIGACCLVARGLSAPDAISVVREVRDSRAVETREQQRFVARFAAAWPGRVAAVRAPAPEDPSP
jgi:protein-tyrosine phosphatase